jgi:hypothetical protein
MTDTDAAAAAKAENDLIRQGERTIDNLKRLFAVVFALSFGVVATGAIEKLRPLLTAPNVAAPPWWLWLLNLEMIGVFVVTAGVFYHQSAKFLDIRYAKHPLSQAHPMGFAADYIILVLTVAPFYFLAHALSASVTHVVGYFWFVVFYIGLLGLGLALLLVAEIRHSDFFRVRTFQETIAPDEVRREHTLRTYWLLMNSLILLVVLALFWIFSFFTPCPPAGKDSYGLAFLALFGVTAYLRDYFDFRYAWRFLYPLRESSAAGLDKWPMTRIVASQNLAPFIAIGLAFVAAAVVLAAALKLWRISFWMGVCS